RRRTAPPAPRRARHRPSPRPQRPARMPTRRFATSLPLPSGPFSGGGRVIPESCNDATRVTRDVSGTEMAGDRGRPVPPPAPAKGTVVVGLAPRRTPALAARRPARAAAARTTRSARTAGAALAHLLELLLLLGRQDLLQPGVDVFLEFLDLL